MSNLPIIETINANINALKSTKTDIKEAVNVDYDIISNEQIEAYPGLIKQQIDTYKARIPHETIEGSSISKSNTIPLKMDNLKIKGDRYNIIPQPSNTNIHYEELEYIESTGTQYIDTGRKSTANTKLEMDYLSEKQNGGAFQCLFGSQNGTTGQRAYLLVGSSEAIQTHFPYSVGNKVLYMRNDGTFSSSSGDNDVKFNNGDRNKIIYDIPNRSLTIGEYTSESVSTQKLISSSYNILIFARNDTTAPTSNLATGKLYSFKWYENNVLTMDFVPCRKYDWENETEEVGLFDLISQTFFGNAGTGNFSAGNEVWHSVTGDCSVVVNGTSYPLSLGDLKIEDNGYGSYNKNYIFKNNENWYLHEVSYIDLINGRVTPGQVYPQDIQITDETLIAQLEALDKAKAATGTTIITTSGDDLNPIYNATIYTEEVS